MAGISGFNRYEINGLISTDKPVLENLERICNNSGCWFSYDAYTGRWSVIINEPGTSIRSFDDSNIIGSIRVSGTSLTDLYNSVEIQFPQRDLNDKPDFIKIEIPAEDRNANEPDNTLSMTLDLINEQTQASVLGLMELKQSRVDKVITFVSDYTALSLNAGDIIDVTISQYGFSNKLFRIVSLNEQEDDSGQITIEISALEYDPDVYDYTTVDRYTRTTADGIITKGSINTPATPQITKFEKDARPRVLIESVVPAGIVEGVEFWTSSDNSTFILAGTEYPTGGGAWATGTTATFDYDWADGGNVYAKVRGVNSTTTSQYSNTASVVYTPVQTTNAIAPTTDVVGSGGDSLLGTLSASALIALIKGLMEDNASGANTLFGQTFNVFDQQTGLDLIEAQNAAMYWNQANRVRDTTGPYSSRTYTGLTAPCWTNGDLLYVVATFDFDYGGSTITDTHFARIRVYKNGSLIATQSSAANSVESRNDQSLSLLVLGTNFSVGDLITVDYTVSSVYATAVNIDSMVFQPFSSS